MYKIHRLELKKKTLSKNVYVRFNKSPLFEK